MNRTSFAAVVFSAFALMLISVFGDEAKAVTRIELVVNDKPITNYDIQQRSRLIALTTRAPASVANRQAKEELIEETLKLDEAERVGIQVQEQEVANAFATIANRVKLSPTQFSAALNQNGVNPKTLQARLKAEIAWSQVVRDRFRATVRINESDVIAALQKKKPGESQKTVQYDLQQVVFVVPANASKNFVNRRQSEMKKLRERFTSCSAGLKLATGLKEVVVKPLGKRLETSLPGGLKAELDKISVGRLTPPTKVANGFEMIALCDKQDIDSDAAARDEIEGELRNKEGQQMSRRYLRDLKARAVIERR